MKSSEQSITFQARQLELGRKYMWRQEFLPLLHGYLEVSPGQTVVDVGCGTGFFTRLVARGLKGHGRVVGVDIDEKLLRVARKLTEEEGLGDMIAYRKGDAMHLPLREGFADRVVCQTLLWIFKDPRPAISEMIRVCQSAGLVGAVEGAFDSVIWHVPGNSRLSELLRKRVEAETKGHNRLRGSDRGIGYKLPGIFRELGLSRVRLDAYGLAWLEGDDRIPADFKVRANKLHLQEARKKNSEYEDLLCSGGMSTAQIQELRRLECEYRERFMKDPKLFETDASMNGGIFFIATGRKSG